MKFTIIRKRQCYSSTHDRNGPLVCIKLIDKCYYAIIKSQTSDKFKGLPIKFKYSKTIDFLSISYHNVDIYMILANNSLIEFGETHITTCLLVLPELGISGNSSAEDYSMFYIINSEWDELKHNMQVRSLASPRCQY